MKRTPVFSASDFGTMSEQNANSAAFQANCKLDNLIESWPVVYGIKRADNGLWTMDEQPGPHDTHSARLAFIEELKPKECEHEPADYVMLDQVYPKRTFQTKCEKCNAKLKATWTVAE